MNAKNKEEILTLEILEAIDKQSNVTQRHIANRLNVALGLANSYLKRCVRKGLIKIEQAPANRYLYYLTPVGFAEKSRLTADFLTSSFDFYRRASRSCSEVFLASDKNQCKSVLLCGVSELAEIALLRAQEYGIVVVGFYDPDIECENYLSLPVWKSLEEADKFCMCMITSLINPGNYLTYLEDKISTSKIYIPNILGLIKGQEYK